MIGSTISHYKILDKLGEGGMGVVYKAQDTTLDRTVALKFLPDHVAVGSAELERFVQEAKAAAGLNHPNICTIYGIEESEKKHFIVMEFVDGQTLQEKKSSLSMKQALDVGIQIAEGLAAAHEKGIVHRDIKPENIMFRKDGRVQIMDFGLAKLRGASRLTKEGSTVGTAGYMSPEQVQGLETDHRSDIFSLGVLLYEMVTGQPLFKGVHETAIAYEVVNVDTPPPSSIKPEIQPELDMIVLECLEKDPNERMQSAKQVSLDLNRIKRTSSRARMSQTGHSSMLRSGSFTSGLASRAFPASLIQPPFVWIIAAIALVALTAWGVSLLATVGESTVVNRVNLSAINSPNQLIFRSDVPCMDISPDGRSIVYALSDGGTSQLYIRSLESYEIRSIVGTNNGTAPFYSPDGQWIGFVADGKIKKVPAAGGTVESLCDAQGFRGASWGEDNRIYYSPDFAAGIFSVSAQGGDPREFSRLDSSKGERTHRWPFVFPGGKWVLYTVGDQRNPNSYTDGILTMQSIQTGERHELNARGEMARYISSGYLVVGRSASLLSAPFSVDEFRTTKPLSVAINGVNGDPGSGVLDFAISANGHLAYLPGTLSRDFDLVWISRDGKTTPLPLPQQAYNTPRLSPDGTKLAVSLGIPGGDNDIWIYDLTSGSSNRLTFSKTVNSPLWSIDGKKLYYSVTVPLGIMVQPADGSSRGDIVFRSAVPMFPVSFTPNGRDLVLTTLGGSSSMLLHLDKKTEPEVISTGSSYSYGGAISPDGKYITYGSNETGMLEVFVLTFPGLKGKWQVSTGGGINPVWSHDGKEIFYVSTVGKMLVVPIKTSPVFSPGTPQELFDVSQMYFPNTPVTNYDVTADGKRFIMIQNSRSGARTSSFNYVQNWVTTVEKEAQ